MLAVALVGSLAGVSAFAASGNTQSTPAADTAAQKKDAQETAASHTSSETVYVIANTDGSAQKVIVSQKYDAGDANAAQEAQSTLTDPQNVKGDNCWQGTTDKALPVTVAITYTLDGKTVTAEELAGKSGHVTMRFDYTNTQYETRAIGGKQEKIYVPFAVLTGALLDSDHFTNVSVTNGKLVGRRRPHRRGGHGLPRIAGNAGVGHRHAGDPHLCGGRSRRDRFHAGHHSDGSLQLPAE